MAYPAMGRTKEDDDDVLLNFVDSRTSRQATEALERNLLVALGARRGRSFHTAIRFRDTIAVGSVKCPSSTREDANSQRPTQFQALSDD